MKKRSNNENKSYTTQLRKRRLHGNEVLIYKSENILSQNYENKGDFGGVALSSIVLN